MYKTVVRVVCSFVGIFYIVFVIVVLVMYAITLQKICRMSRPDISMDELKALKLEIRELR